MNNFQHNLRGLLLGSAVGDALGLPAEGLSPARIQRRWGREWRMRLFINRGMVSDDTEHMVMVAQSLLSSPNDAAVFQKRLAWRLRYWFCSLPAGVGLATSRACIKLWIGVPPSRSGVNSAGNGPAMRSAVIGAFFANNSTKLREFVTASTRLTHTDRRAEMAALAVAQAAAWIIRNEKPPEDFLLELPSVGNNAEWLELCRKVAEAHASGRSVSEFAQMLGLSRGVSGYAFHTVPVAIYAWLQHPNDFSAALTSALDCGGDTDTVGAVVGALAGARTGAEGIPKAWRDGMIDWPCTLGVLERLAARLAEQTTQERPLGPVPYFWPGLIPRNLLFLLVVLGHGFRRLFPPY